MKTAFISAWKRLETSPCKLATKHTIMNMNHKSGHINNKIMINIFNIYKQRLYSSNRLNNFLFQICIGLQFTAYAT